MKLVLATHESSLAHDTGPRHPERPARVPAVVAGVSTAGADMVNVHPEPIERDLLAAVHDPDYIDSIERFCAAGGGALDLDTYAAEASWDAALRAAQGGVDVCDALRRGDGDLGYVVMRPPGHHAVADRAMGFCLFNNVAVVAAALVASGERVAIVDWDVHHGNGTQDIFYSEPSVLYLSVHQAGIYPGTGSPGDLGAGEAVGTNLNIAVPAGTGGSFYRPAFSDLVTPVLRQFDPDWVLVSSGFDAHADDPLAALMLVADDYAAMARAVAAVSPPQRGVIFLEGGYDLDALEASSRATVQGWLDPQHAISAETAGIGPTRLLDSAHEQWSEFWDL